MEHANSLQRDVDKLMRIVVDGNGVPALTSRVTTIETTLGNLKVGGAILAILIPFLTVGLLISALAALHAAGINILR